MVGSGIPTIRSRNGRSAQTGWLPLILEGFDPARARHLRGPLGFKLAVLISIGLWALLIALLLRSH